VDLYGAAGPRLRAALGAHWRGKTVTVRSGSVTLRIKLIDWCQCYKGRSYEKLIDLYWDAYSRLPSNKIRISW